MLRLRDSWLAVLFIYCLLLVAAGLPWRKARPLRSPDTNMRLGMINVVDPRMVRRLVKGFEAAENNFWRWAEPEFSVILSPPVGAAEKGAVLVLHFIIADTVPGGEKSMDLYSTVNGVALPPRHYGGPGQFTFKQEVPAAAFSENPVRADFKVSRALLTAERGVIVSEVGFELR